MTKYVRGDASCVRCRRIGRPERRQRPCHETADCAARVVVADYERRGWRVCDRTQAKVLERAGVPVQWAHGGVTKGYARAGLGDITHEVPFAPANAVRALNALAALSSSSITATLRAATIAVVWKDEEQVDALHTVRLLDARKLPAYARKITRGVIL